ncbi:uncharacterized protein ACA1_065760 [Acanthamoeba castellanii str. Neff]|uniref:Uncharacterized protein n=1 Tax=Acanthamoeba castellanii (strain ATCC 30010 / Neff) TaxID=1257118 RepID=L8H042_ACACF|nr:uncharacterized protein ACA1_065760 [Acanthamoeba castellanii str. Neff]ELR17756.1 hypothetical protein ACA1_065760 [Acanthamoeba castellanii str. Neff]
MKLNISTVLLSLVALVALLQAAMAADVILTNGLLTSTLTPAGGKITISESNGNDTKTFVLQTKLMTEMAKNTAVKSVSSFIRETFLATDPIDETYQGIKASTATIFMDIPMDGSSANATSVLSLSIKVSVFQEEGYVKLGSRKFAVDTGKLAITYTILDWPFDSYDNTLVVRTSIETPSAGGSMSGSELFLFNGASWTFAPTAAIPAPYDSSPVTVKSSNTDSGIDTNMQFYATSSITYDTLWSVETATSGATRLTSFLAFF